MVSRDVVVCNKDGLHSKTATVFSEKARQYKSMIWVKRQNIEADAKSLLNVLSLGAFQGTEIRIVAEGPDENEALESICAFVSNEFSE